MAALYSVLGMEVTEYLDSMPAAYAQAFSARDVVEHAGIVARVLMRLFAAAIALVPSTGSLRSAWSRFHYRQA